MKVAPKDRMWLFCLAMLAIAASGFLESIYSLFLEEDTYVTRGKLGLTFALMTFLFVMQLRILKNEDADDY